MRNFSTHAWVRSGRSRSTIQFGRTLTNTTLELACAGAVNGAIPLPTTGRIVGMVLYNGSTVSTVTNDVRFQAGDLLSVRATYASSAHTVTVRINGSDTVFSVGNIGVYLDVAVTLLIDLLEPHE